MSTLRVNNVTDIGLDAVVTNGVVEKGALPVGTILQVVSTTKTDTFTVTSTSFSDVTGLTVSITPSSTSSKVLVMVTLNTSSNPSLVQAQARLLRDSTAIGGGAAAGSRTPAWTDSGNNGMDTSNIVYLDSPNTTSSTAYKIQVRGNTANPVYVNQRVSDSDAVEVTRTASTITVMEVAG